MRKLLSLLIMVGSTFILQAQPFSNPALNSLVQAEFDFISDAKQYGTKKAFYNNLADSAITFGKTIRKGRTNFEGESDTVSWLNWIPVYTDISSTGDFGYNTGPWEFWAKRSDEKPIAFGEFVTVWEKQADGKWKALIDIGIYHNVPMREEPVSTSTNSLKKKKGDATTLATIEKQFIRQSNYSAFISKEIRFYRGNKLPITKKEEVDQLIREQPKLTYTFIDEKEASSGDLGYVYGTAVGTDSATYYYLRIWKKENGNWKIVLDLLTPQ